MLQRVPNVHAQDSDGQHAGGAGDDADQRLNFSDLHQQFFLLLLLVVAGVVEEIWSSS